MFEPQLLKHDLNKIPRILAKQAQIVSSKALIYRIYGWPGRAVASTPGPLHQNAGRVELFAMYSLQPDPAYLHTNMQIS